MPDLVGHQPISATPVGRPHSAPPNVHQPKADTYVTDTRHSKYTKVAKVTIFIQKN